MMEFQIELNEDQMRKRQENIEILKKNELVLYFLEQNHLPLTFVDENSGVLLQWVKSVNQCKNCKGLDYCTQGMKGKVLKLNVDDFGYLNDCYVSCRFKKSMEQQMAHQSKFRLSHMSEADYLIDLNDDSFQKAIQDSDYAQVYNGVVGSIALNKGVYLYGNPGVGKSYLLKGVSNYYAKNGKSVSFVQVPLLIQELKQFMTDNEYRQNLLGHLRFSDVLILDDIGAESITQWTRDEILLPVLDQRMNNNLKTYFTSNYSLEELEQQYRACSKMNGNVASLRILERIRTLSNPISLMGKSRRS